MRQPARRLALPVELQRRRAHDDRRERLVGLQRGKRLDRLAEPLLVGEERAASVEHVAHAGPLERLERAAESCRHRGDRLALGRARGADRGARLGCLRAQPLEHRRGQLRDLDAVQREERLERLAQPRVDRHRALALGTRQLPERQPRVRIPQHLQPQARAVDAVRRHEPRRRRVVAQLQRGDAALGGGVEPRRLLRAQRVRGLLAERDKQRRLARRRARPGRLLERALDRALPQLRRHLSGRRLQHEPAAAVVAGGGHPPEPAPLDLAEPCGDLLARRQLREAAQHVGDVVRDPVLDRRPPLARVPVEAAVRDPAHDLDEVRVVGERQHDDPPPLRMRAQLDVRRGGDEPHRLLNGSGRRTRSGSAREHLCHTSPMAEGYAITQEGLDALRAELQDLETRARGEIAARIKTAREWGDLKENAEYHAAKEDQAHLETRIKRLQERLRGARVVDGSATPDGVVGFGSTVEVRDEGSGRVASYTLVGAAEASARDGRLSIESPVASRAARRARGRRRDGRDARRRAHVPRRARGRVARLSGTGPPPSRAGRPRPPRVLARRGGVTQPPAADAALRKRALRMSAATRIGSRSCARRPPGRRAALQPRGRRPSSRRSR